MIKCDFIPCVALLNNQFKCTDTNMFTSRLEHKNTTICSLICEPVAHTRMLVSVVNVLNRNASSDEACIGPASGTLGCPSTTALSKDYVSQDTLRRVLSGTDRRLRVRETSVVHVEVSVWFSRFLWHGKPSFLVFCAVCGSVIPFVSRKHHQSSSSFGCSDSRTTNSLCGISFASVVWSNVDSNLKRVVRDFSSSSFKIRSPVRWKTNISGITHSLDVSSSCSGFLNVPCLFSSACDLT